MNAWPLAICSHRTSRTAVIADATQIATGVRFQSYSDGDDACSPSKTNPSAAFPQCQPQNIVGTNVGMDGKPMLLQLVAQLIVALTVHG